MHIFCNVYKCKSNESGLLIPVQKELSVSRRAQTRSQRKSMIVQVNKVPCSIKAIFDISKTVKHYVTIDEKEISPVKPTVCSLQTTSPTMPRCHSPSTTLSPLGEWSMIMFELLSFFVNVVTVSILSPPLLSFPLLRLPESVAFTICICEHKKGWWTKVVCSQPSQVIRRRIPGLRFQISKPCLAVVAVMAQHQAQATYQVNVLVRLVRSWFSSQGCCSTWLQHRRGFIS